MLAVVVSIPVAVPVIRAVVLAVPVFREVLFLLMRMGTEYLMRVAVMVALRKKMKYCLTFRLPVAGKSMPVKTQTSALGSKSLLIM